MSGFKAKMLKIRFPLGLRPGHRWRSLQRSRDHSAVFKGPTSEGRAGEEVGEGKGGREDGGSDEGREAKGAAPPQYFGLERPLPTWSSGRSSVD